MIAQVIIVSLSAFFVSTFCEASTPVRRCPGDLPFPLSVQIEDCQAMPCVLIRGTTAAMDVQFVATADETYQIDAEVYATIFGLVIPYPLPNDGGNVCANLLYGAYCPLYATEDVVYHIDFPVEKTVPEVSLKAEVKLFDKERNVVTCFVTDLKVRRS